MAQTEILVKYVDEQLADTLTSMGFVRRGRLRFVYESDSVGLFVVRSHPFASPYLGFRMEWAVIPRSHIDFFRDRGERQMHVSWGVVGGIVETPAEFTYAGGFPAEDWAVRLPDGVAGASQAQRSILADAVLPWMVRMCSADELVTWDGDWDMIPALCPIISQSPSDAAARYIATHIDTGPVDRLRAHLDEFERSTTYADDAEWAAWWRSRLAARTAHE